MALFGLPFGDQAIFVRRDVLNGIGGIPQVPVMEDGAFVGIITETDLLKLVTEGIQAEPPAAQTVAEYMTADVITVTRDVDIYYVAGVFIANKFRRLPVVEEGRIVGAITRFDLLRVISKLLAEAEL